MISGVPSLVIRAYSKVGVGVGAGVVRHGAPLGISIPTLGLVNWVRADSENLSDGDPVSTVTDNSGNGYDWSQGTASHRPTFKTAIVNGRHVFRFATDDHFDGPSGIVDVADGEDKPLSFFVVFTATSQTSRIIFWTNSGEFTILNTIAGDKYNIFKRDGTTTKTHDSSAAGYASNFVIAAMVTSGTSVDLWENNSQIITAGDMNITSVDVTGVTIGASGDGANPLAGDIAEWLIYNRAVSTAEREAVQNYLSAKYAITLS